MENTPGQRLFWITGHGTVLPWQIVPVVFIKDLGGGVALVRRLRGRKVFAVDTKNLCKSTST